MDRAPLSAALPAPVREAAAGLDLEAELQRLYQAGQAAWPRLEVSGAAFAAHLGRHLPADGTLSAWLSERCAADLYLACGCAAGHPAALQAFEQAILSRLPELLARLGPQPADVDEVRQRLCERLLCARPDGPGRIADYAGSGSLLAFVRVAAVRLALSLRRGAGDRRTDPLDEDTVGALAEGGGDALGPFRGRYQAELRAALADAFASLSPDERNVLRLRFALGQTIEQAAAALRVSRATLVRWQAAAERQVRRVTLRLLRQRLRLSADELESLIRFVRSQLELSLSQLFAPPTP